VLSDESEGAFDVGRFGRSWSSSKFGLFSAELSRAGLVSVEGERSYCSKKVVLNLSLGGLSVLLLTCCSEAILSRSSRSSVVVRSSFCSFNLILFIKPEDIHFRPNLWESMFCYMIALIDCWSIRFSSSTVPWNVLNA
jgi:hypothetical protein